MSTINESDYWLGFSVFPGIGPKKFILLIEEFKTAKEAWEASEGKLVTILGPALTRKFVTYREKINLIDYAKRLEKASVWYLLSSDVQYPQLLKQIDDPPFVLYGRGDKKVLTTEHIIGIVGTRKITSYGRHVTEMITRELVGAGYCVVSGLAMGVDAIAHATTINEGGKTIAVLGCGADCCSPRENTLLYNRIISEGSCVVSEFPLSQSPTPGSFPSRNRIIAGLSQAVVVTEGAVDSGALITASDALKNNRPVFAIPGPITSSLSKGPNKLLREGARLVAGGEDIIRELGGMGISRHKGKMSGKVIKGESVEEQAIINVLMDEELSFDELIVLIKSSPAILNMQLSMMEMKGIIQKTQNGNFQLCA